MQLGLLNLSTPDLHYVQDWLPPMQAEQLYAQLHKALPWAVHQVRIAGRDLPTPRLCCWIGDDNAVYGYSGKRHAPYPWIESLQHLRERLQLELNTEFNSVLANLYRDGNDTVGWHSDNEHELGVQPVIASLSLGAARVFAIKQKQPPRTRYDLTLENGSLLVMQGSLQRDYVHSIPRRKGIHDGRINLTFRFVQR